MLIRSTVSRLKFLWIGLLALWVSTCWCSLAHADGLIVIDSATPVPNHFVFAPLEVSFHHVTVNITDQIAVTGVDEEFKNTGSQAVEGTYIFPVPTGAHIDKFSMDINGKQLDAELLDADKARQYYQETVRRFRDPALLEYVGRGAVRVHIFPIEAGGSRHVKLQYTQLLANESGVIEYLYPLNTEKFSSRPLHDVSITVKINSSDPIKSIYSPTHATSIRREGDCQATVGYEQTNVRPDTDFKVLYATSKSMIGANLLCHREGNEDGYFMLLASPGLNTAHKSQAKDICFVLDTSGSMADADKIIQAKKALNFCLSNLNENDRFQVIRFSTDVEPMFDGLVPADENNVKRAKQFVASLKATGGTALNDALQKSLALSKTGDKSRPFNVVFLTDGMPTVGENNDDLILQNARTLNTQARVFCFGIGSDVNTHLLDGIAAETRATSTYVTGTEDIEVKVSSFFSKIREPVLTDVKIEFIADGLRTLQIYPTSVTDLFKGESLTVFGRYNASEIGSGSGTVSGSVKISGMIDGERREFVTDVKFPHEARSNEFIAQLWATRRVGFLLDEIRLRGENVELKNEIVSLARQFGIVTPYTAYLIIEDERVRKVPVAMQSFTEMQKDRVAFDKSTVSYNSAKAEASDQKQQTGGQAVANAQSLSQMRSVDNAASAASQPSYQMMNKERAAVSDSQQGYRQTSNYAQQARWVNGRAFYQNGSIWTDSSIQQSKGLKQVEVKLSSDAYFDLLKAHPEAAAWLAIGLQVDVVIGDSIYSIR